MEFFFEHLVLFALVLVWVLTFIVDHYIDRRVERKYGIPPTAGSG